MPAILRMPHEQLNKNYSGYNAQTLKLADAENLFVGRDEFMVISSA